MTALRTTLRRIRESIGRATITLPGLAPMMIQLDRDEQKPEPLLVKVAREGGEWWKEST